MNFKQGDKVKLITDGDIGGLNKDEFCEAVDFIFKIDICSDTYCSIKTEYVMDVLGMTEIELEHI